MNNYIVKIRNSEIETRRVIANDEEEAKTLAEFGGGVFLGAETMSEAISVEEEQ